jgi:hypothetical protein
MKGLGMPLETNKVTCVFKVFCENCDNVFFVAERHMYPEGDEWVVICPNPQCKWKMVFVDNPFREAKTV